MMNPTITLKYQNKENTNNMTNRTQIYSIYTFIQEKEGKALMLVCMSLTCTFTHTGVHACAYTGVHSCHPFCDDRQSRGSGCSDCCSLWTPATNCAGDLDSGSAAATSGGGALGSAAAASEPHDGTQRKDSDGGPPCQRLPLAAVGLPRSAVVCLDHYPAPIRRN